MFVGEKLGRYEIVKMIGAGGMGEVFLAKDTQLGREVALKVLLSEFCLDEDRVKRFMYEARAVSALNHPGIITIHEIVEENEKLFIATEFVDGETVREKLEEKSLDLYQAVSIAEQVADALAVAHDARIAHRDIKPENIMVRKDGIAKVLDFGLAKPLIAAGENEHLLVKTQPGLVIGSVRYMSPEQARGKDTDGRTDIWSLGVVLYEMLTGETPFDGETISDQLAALIHAEPKQLTEVPAELEEIIGNCLQKDADNRYATVKRLGADLRRVRLDLERDIEDSINPDLTNTIALPRQNTSENATLIHRTISSDKTTGINVEGKNPTMEANRGRISRFAPIAAAVVVGFLAMAGWYSISAWFGGDAPEYDSIQVSRLTDDGNSGVASVSPDGKIVAFANTTDTGSKIYVRQVATGSEVEIVPETDATYLQPVFSPDGDFIYYVGVRNGVGTLKRVSALGGEAKEISKDVDSRPAISPDGKSIAFFRHDPTRGGDKIFVIDSEGESQQQLSATSELGVDKLYDLFWSSDGKRVMTVGVKLSDQMSQVSRLMAIDTVTKKIVEDKTVRIFEESKWSPAFGFQSLADGSGIIFVGRRSADEAMQLWHLSYANERVRAITTDTSDYEAISASADGKTVIATKAEWTGGMISYDPLTKEQRQIKPESNKVFGYNGLSTTPDDQILYSSRDGKEINIYAIDPTTGNERRLTSGNRYNIHPVTEKKTGKLIFASNRGGSFGIWKVDKDGANPVQLTSPENGSDVSPVMSVDTATVYFMRKMNDGGLSKLMKVPLSGGKAEELLPDSKTSNMMPRISRDGKKFAFVAVSFEEDIAKLTSELQIGEISEGVINFDSDTDDEIETSYEQWFSWSPDGKSFTKLKKETGSQLWNASLDGKTETQLTTFSSGRIRSFTWSSDGSKLYIVKGVSRSDLVLIKTEATS